VSKTSKETPHVRIKLFKCSQWPKTLYTFAVIEKHEILEMYSEDKQVTTLKFV